MSLNFNGYKSYDTKRKNSKNANLCFWRQLQKKKEMACHNDCLNLSFVKDEHTYFKKMARIGRNTVIYKGTFVSNQSLLEQESP